MTLCQAYAALTRVTSQIVAAPNSPSRDELLSIRRSLLEQIRGK